MIETCWQTLGIEPTSDLRTIKRAYARLLRRFHPEDDPGGFQRLHESYRRALDLARGVVPAPAPPSMTGTTRGESSSPAVAVEPPPRFVAERFLTVAGRLYDDEKTRTDPDAWRDLLTDPALDDLAVKQILTFRTFGFLARCLEQDRRREPDARLRADTIKDFELAFDWTAHELELARRFDPTDVDRVMFQVYGYHAVAAEPPARRTVGDTRSGDLVGWVFVVLAALAIAQGASHLIRDRGPAPDSCRALWERGDDGKRLADCRARVDAGDTRAAAWLALFLAVDEPSDSIRAVEAYRVVNEATRHSDDRAALFVAAGFDYVGIGTERDADRAAGRLRRAADAGLARAQAALGMLILTGEASDTDPAAARDFLDAASEAGYGPADAGLALLYRFGYGGPVDADKALEYLERAALRDVPWTTNRLAWMLATSPDAQFRDAGRALALVPTLVRHPDYASQFALIDTVAAVQAAAGRFEAAVRIQARALEQAKRQSVDAATIDDVATRLALFESGRAYTAPAGDDPREQADELLLAMLLRYDSDYWTVATP